MILGMVGSQFDRAMRCLADESRREYETVDQSTGNDRDIIQKVTTLTRASLISGPFDSEARWFSRATSCLGATTILNALLRQQGYRTSYGIVERYPWQDGTTSRETHTVSLASRANSDCVYIADPMPLAGYLYGQVLPAERTSDAAFRSRDSILDGNLIIRPVSDAKVSAMADVAIMRASPSMVPADNIKTKLHNALVVLTDIPSYYARALVLDDELSGDPRYSSFNQLAAPGAMRRSQYPKIRRSETVKTVERLRVAEDSRKQQMAPLAHRAVVAAADTYDKNYWTSVHITLAQGYDHIKNHPLTQLTWEAFSQTSGEPIRAYERFMLSNGLGLCKSSSYRRAN